LRRKVFHVCDGRSRLGTNCRLGDVEAELQKLAVDMRRTPEMG
jgi:hypothetical protein